MIAENAIARFWPKVDKAGDCWIWKASKRRKGYGQFQLNGTMVSAHRVAWQIEHGEIPAGLLVCHHCDNPSCVRPDHLFLGTNSDNQKDAGAKKRHWTQNTSRIQRCTQILKDRTACQNGHEYTPENTTIRRGCRECRTCARKYRLEYYHRTKGRAAARLLAEGGQ